MKVFKVAVAVAGLLIGTIASADSINLRSANNVGIRISFQQKKEAVGQTSSVRATGVQVLVQHGIPGETRVILINKCRSFAYPTERSFEYAFDCGYRENGTVLLDQCVLRGDIGEAQFYAQDLTSVLVQNTTYGFSVGCRQELAVELSRGNWLVDPVNGTHNFQFRFSY
ncbi:MAG: hypothetical protein A2428_07120 [Bdellovibrionales bacterium RIFOXYC1_FULL_54_43]|nr:MAG: hypothetical protein A2428_07120 [Bdellovibrionales bacterium RIFOXYC1_FULL_54_43]OFZ79313.1 MAG: hypothetical protein A2603_08705 [Bdellovibrionales bacterium RIFOXYD1_FULL_55_31]